MPQGLGTGALYTNNIESPLEVRNGELCYNQKLAWKMEL
jgi:O-succinylbenzoate synthase